MIKEYKIDNTEHTVIKGNSIEEIDRLSTNEFYKIDACITDPPYNVSNTNVIKFKTRKDMSRDFGSWDYFTDEEYWAFTKNWISSVSKVLKPGGNLLTFCRLENISHVKEIYESLKFAHGATIIWHRSNPAPRVRKTGLLSSCEAILWAHKLDEENPKLRPTLNFGKQNEMHNFIETSICMGNERKKQLTVHPTQKPLKLMQHLIKIFTTEGDTIIDPFAGNGSTAHAAALLGRNSLSFEIEEAYFDSMCNRLDNIDKKEEKVGTLE